METTKMSLVNDVMIHKATGKSVRILSETDSTKNRIAADITYGVAFENGDTLDCHQKGLGFFRHNRRSDARGSFVSNLTKRGTKCSGNANVIT